jgi:hypothetical protein
MAAVEGIGVLLSNPAPFSPVTVNPVDTISTLKRF